MCCMNLYMNSWYQGSRCRLPLPVDIKEASTSDIALTTLMLKDAQVRQFPKPLQSSRRQCFYAEQTKAHH